MVFLLFFPSVTIAYRGDGCDGRQVEVGKVGGITSKGIFGVAMMPVDVHTMAYAALVGHRGSGSNLRFPSTNWQPPSVPLFNL